MSDDVQRSLGQIEAKVDILLERTSAYEKRIGAIEKKVWWSSGAAAIIAFVVTKLPALGGH